VLPATPPSSNEDDGGEAGDDDGGEAKGRPTAGTPPGGRPGTTAGTTGDTTAGATGDITAGETGDITAGAAGDMRAGATPGTTAPPRDSRGSMLRVGSGSGAGFGGIRVMARSLPDDVRSKKALTTDLLPRVICAETHTTSREVATADPPW
jgi:hypothetical protein